MMKRLALFAALLLPLAAADIPAEARALTEARDKEVNRVNLAYAQKLDALKVKYAAAGETEKVAAVMELIAAVEADGKKKPAADAGEVLAPLVGVWQHENGQVWTFTNAKSGLVNGKHRFSASYDPLKRRVIVVGDSWVHYLTFTADKDLVTGSEERGGKVTRYKLKRIK